MTMADDSKNSDENVLQAGLHWLLNLSSDVERDEVVDATLFLLNLFVVLVAYYVIKTVREPLILATGGAEMKSYASAYQAGLLVGYIPLYGWFTGILPRMKLNAALVLFFVVCIELFFFASFTEAPNIFALMGGSTSDGAGGALSWLAANITLGFVFYVWVGIFSLSTIAQFWSYANDVYDESAGKRLFPVIAIGATVGAPVGSAVAGLLFAGGVDAYAMLQISAGLLLVHLGLYWLLEKRYCGRLAERADESDEAREKLEEAEEQCPGEDRGGFEMILKSPYLRWIALFFILLNLVNTTGEYILGSMVEDAAKQAVAAGTAVSMEAFIGQFYGNFFSVVNVVAVVIQAFLVSRILKWFGMRGMLFALPVVALGTYGFAAFGVGLTAFKWAKTAENSTDYSVMNTTRALVWLPTTRAEKYVAKQAIDTFFVRFGDVLSAGFVFVGTTWLQFAARDFAYTNLVLIGLWFVVGLFVYRLFRKLSEDKGVTEEDLREEANSA